MSVARADFTTYVVVSVWFGCNNDCGICMLGDLKRQLPGIGLEAFARLLEEIRAAGRHTSLILSGAEVTTCGTLEEYVRAAAGLRWFKRIQIQTNGRRLADPAYLDRLLDWGVNEFFVSVQGLEATHDRTTRRPGAFRETTAGLRNLAERQADVITATVLTRANLREVPALLTALAEQRVNELQLWNYFPMEPTDPHDLVVSVPELLELLEALRPVAGRAGKPVVFKSFPQCLDPGEPIFFDSWFPATVLPPRFWHQFSQSGWGGCAWREAGECASRACWGLSAAHRARHGDARGLLHPIRPAAAGAPGGGRC
jgi:MoaA/NifB/PqqE/SkfB family radical SAM enzyme